MREGVYSQNDEQQAILEAVSHVANKRFLDIGGYHFETFSNTRQLFLDGWSGVMFEPAPHLMAGLVRDLGKEERIELVCAAVGVEERLATLYVTADMLSSVNKAWRDEREEVAAWLGRMKIQQVTLSQIGQWFEGFEFVSIDAEGTSVDIALDMLRIGWRPTCWCCEIDERPVELAAEATKAGYRLTYASQENFVFAR